MPQPANRHPHAQLIKAVQAQRRTVPGLDDEPTWRALLTAVTGKDSLRRMGAPDFGRVLDELTRRGAPRRQLKVRPTAELAGQVALARALWISLHQLGAVEDPSDDALEAWARRQTKGHTADGAGLPALAWAGPAEMRSIVEGLWAIAGRHGWNKPIAPEIRAFAELREAHGLPPAGPATLAKIKLVMALWQRLVEDGVFRSATFAKLTTWLQTRSIATVQHPYQLDADQAERAAVKLAAWVAEVRAKGAAA